MFLSKIYLSCINNYRILIQDVKSRPIWYISSFLFTYILLTQFKQTNTDRNIEILKYKLAIKS